MKPPYIARTVTPPCGPDDDSAEHTASQPLSAYRDAPAYVLLGDPGAGKTRAFEHEAARDGRFVTAREFLRGDIDDLPNISEETLFIDGLDEQRTSRGDPRIPLDKIVVKLRALGPAGFRLSCRPAEWGLTDLKEVASVVKDKQLPILRLDPLNPEGVRTLLRHLLHGTSTTADEFIRQAWDHNYGGLLGNPHSLELLAKAVVDGDWPVGRSGVFNRACRVLTEERNHEHLDGGPLASPALVLAAACEISALALLTGAAAICRHSVEADDDDLSLADVASAIDVELHKALGTKLFSMVAHGRFVPVHQNVAEYLGARHLRDVVEDSGCVPSTRIVALLTDDDGVVAPGLRGLAAWLAALCPAVRKELISADPIGALLYGDAGRFGNDDAALLIRTLEGSVRQIQRHAWSAPALGSLVRPITLKRLHAFAADDDRSDGRQTLTEVLLQGIRYAPANAFKGHGRCEIGTRSLVELLLDFVRDDTWWPRVRTAGIIAVHEMVQRNGTGNRLLDELLDDIKVGRIRDPDNELRGRLLNLLYPHRISPEEVWDFIPSTANRHLMGHDLYFWSRKLEARTPDADLPALMDGLSNSGSRLLAVLREDQLASLATRLLVRTLRTHGQSTPVARLSKWLEFAVERNALIFGEHDRGELEHLRSWLAAHPVVCKDCLLAFLQRISDDDGLRTRAWRFRYTVLGNNPPASFDAWCVDNAVRLASSHLPVARLLVDWAVRHRREQPEFDRWIASVHSRMKSHDVLRAHLTEVAKPDDPAAAKAAMEAQVERRSLEAEILQHRQKKDMQHRKYVAHVRQHSEALATGSCDAGLLHSLARTYFGFDSSHMRANPVEALRENLDSDEDLTQAALSGFRHALKRADLPSLDYIVRLDQANRLSLLALPVLAGLAEEDRIGYGRARLLTEDQVRSVVGLYYTSPRPVVRNSIRGWYTPADAPVWLDELIRSQAELVAESFVAVHASRIRRKSHREEPLAEMAWNPKYREMARIALPQLLRSVPVHGTLAQARALRQLLWASIRYLPEKLDSWVQERLLRQDMDVAQRALWLGAGMVVAPERFLASAMDFINMRTSTRLRHLVGFIAPDGTTPLAMKWNAEHLAMAIRGVGAKVAPWPPAWGDDQKARLLTPADNAADKATRLMSIWLNALAQSPEAEAGNALQSLSVETELESWHSDILAALDQQAVLQRVHLYQVPTIAEVQRVLRDAEPANAGDLAALVVDRLKKLARTIRHGNTDEWHQYWNEGTQQCPPRPKHEDRCRDALLSDLRGLLLHTGVHAEPEGQYADDKRADIRVAYNGHALPVEIKKNTHRRLWSAIEDQLITKYVRDPASGGFGVYLALWFGASRTKTPPPSGRPPRTSEELRERLEEQVPREKRHKIKVVVVDVSLPEDRST